MYLLRWRRGLMGVCLTGGVLTGCASASNVPDGAVIQVMQESRERVRREPNTFQPETLSLTGAAKQAAQQDGDSDAMAKLRVTQAPERAAGATAENRIQALALAQNAELRMAQGDLVGAREALDASMAHYPTLDALQWVAPMLAEVGDDATLVSHCKQTFGVSADDDTRFIVLDVCVRHHSARAPEEALAWAEPDVIVWYLERRREGR